MTPGEEGGGRPVVTLVLRMWLVDSDHDPEVFQFQATHVQTGEVTYFRTTQSVAEHVERLARRIVKPANDVIEFRHRE